MVDAGPEPTYEEKWEYPLGSRNIIGKSYEYDGEMSDAQKQEHNQIKATNALSSSARYFHNYLEHLELHYKKETYATT